MKKKKTPTKTYVLIENQRVWEVDVGGVHYSVSSNREGSTWTAMLVKDKSFINQGNQKTIAECLKEMGEKYSCTFELETERDADIRIFGKPIACKRY